MPGKAALNTEIKTYKKRTFPASHPKYFAIPPQTPAKTLSLVLSKFFSIFLFFILYFKMNAKPIKPLKIQ